MEQKHNYTLKQTKWKKFGVDFYQWHPVIPPVLQPSKLSLARQIIRRFQDLIPHRRYAPPSKKGGLNLYKSQGSPKQALANTFEKNPVTMGEKTLPSDDRLEPKFSHGPMVPANPRAAGGFNVHRRFCSVHRCQCTGFRSFFCDRHHRVVLQLFDWFVF